MIELSRHIEILLLSNDCVIVPGLGGFTASHVPAHYDTTDNMVLPPTRTLGFNPKLHINDSLLAQSYTEAYDISYPDALIRIEEETSELRHRLENEGSYELEDIGLLSLNNEGNIEFTPCESGILTPSLYSFGAVDMPLLNPERHIATSTNVTEEKNGQKSASSKVISLIDNILVADDIVKENNESETEITGEKELQEESEPTNNKRRNMTALKYAAVFLGLIVLSLFFNTGNYDNRSMKMSDFNSGIIHDFIKKSYDNIKTSTLKSNISPVPENKVTDNTEPEKPCAKANEKLEPYYCIVLASKVAKRNADVFVDELHKDGFKEATLLQEEGHSLKVVYGHFQTSEDAVNALRNNRTSVHFSDAWIYKANI
ncbi:MAG: SPOR domain-containing protein [Prevotella sp.]